MGNSVKRIKRKKYVIHSSFIRKYTSSPLVDVNNSFEIESQCQLLFVKIGPKSEDKGVMKVLFMSEDTEKYAKEKAAIEEEWSQLLKLNEHGNIIHYLGREYCNDDKGKRRCEILSQHCPVGIDHVKNASKLQMLLWITQIAQAIAHAHECELFHGNIVPSNIAILGDSAILKNFTLCNYTKVYGLGELPITRDMFMPPEEEMAKKEVYWVKKQDVYMWAACALHLLGLKTVLSKLHSKKHNKLAYEATLAGLQATIASALKELEPSGVNPENVAALLLANLRLDPLNRPSMQFTLKQFEVLDHSILDLLKTVCHFCGRGKHRLHQLICGHSLCRKCWYRSIDTNNDETIKACKVCGNALGIGFLKLRCGCSCDKIELEKGIFEATKGRILEINAEGKGYVYPKCAEGHAVCFEDLELIFGEDKVEEAKTRAREEKYGDSHAD